MGPMQNTAPTSCAAAQHGRGGRPRRGATTGGITVAIALTKEGEPYAEITDGPRSIRLRVDKDDLARFESSLETSLQP